MNTVYSPGIRKLQTSNTTRRRVLGFYQIVGGAIGLVMASLVLSHLFSTEYVRDYRLITIVSFVILLYIFSIACGTLLLMNKESAYSYSLAQQAAQVLSLDVGSFGFTYVSGVNLSVGIDVDGTAIMSFHVGISNFWATIGGEAGLHKIMFNLVAIYLIYYIIELRKNIRKEMVLKNAEDLTGAQ
ncbi:MAG TPA: hypothetical protein VD993_02890 [Chitinophagaceae bacterium]|nr:hypothetical protein [Chitinophagaceae bacterium]